MGMIQGQAWTFDTVASIYEKIRPGYCDELYKMIFDYISIYGSSKVVEIGIGGGQATLPILKTGCDLTAVECGEQFSKLCRNKFGNYPNFSVVTNKFENTNFEDGAYDLIYSATAFHWIPEEIGYKKVFSMLKCGGAFARFANHPFPSKDNPALSQEIDRIYESYYNKYYNKKKEVLKEYTEEQAEDIALLAKKYGFTDIRYALFTRERIFSAQEYIRLLGTYSDHISIEEQVRKEFFAEIESAIDRHGGKITIYDTIDLQLARK